VPWDGDHTLAHVGDHTLARASNETDVGKSGEKTQIYDVSETMNIVIIED